MKDTLYARIKPFGRDSESMVVAFKSKAMMEYAKSYCVEFKSLKEAPANTKFWNPLITKASELK
jgi:hypothetical protein